VVESQESAQAPPVPPPVIDMQPAMAPQPYTAQPAYTAQPSYAAQPSYSGQQQQQYGQNPYQSQYSNPIPAQPPHMTVKEWLLAMLVMIIPVVGIIMIFVWAFSGGTNPSKKTYFQALLLWYLICVGASILLSIILFAIGGAIFTSVAGNLTSWLGIYI